METNELPSTAALREFEEEMGARRSCVVVLGAYHDVRAVTGTCVTPVVGVIDHDTADLGNLLEKPSDEVTVLLSSAVQCRFKT